MSGQEPVEQNQRSSLHWPGLRSAYAWLPPHENDSLTGAHQIGISFTDHRGLVQQQGERTRHMDVAAGTVFVTGADTIRWRRVREYTEAVELYPDLAFLARLAEEVGQPGIRFEAAEVVRDPVVLSTAHAFRGVHTGQWQFSDVEVSSLVHRVLWRLLTGYCGVQSGRELRGRLSPELLRRLAEFVDAHLGGALGLEQLAGCAGLSRFHLVRAFKASTGLAPHEFVTLRRMQHARNLLLAGSLPVDEVAHRVGYSNLSHFRRVFRGHMGLLPSALRSATAAARRGAHV